MNCPQSSAAGRLFDAAASLILGISKVSYEGQGPMQLEAIVNQVDDFIDLPLTEENEHFIVDWQPLLAVLQDSEMLPVRRSTIFHNSLAHIIIKQAELLKATYSFDAIGLSGGVFQNKVLVEKIYKLAISRNLKVLIPKEVPVNDGGLSYGQVIEFAAKQA